MPMVGDKKFSYTDEGKRKAKAYATETSKLMHVGYRKGGKPINILTTGFLFLFKNTCFLFGIKK